MALTIRPECKNNSSLTASQVFWVVLLLLIVSGTGTWLYVKFVDKPRDAKVAAEHIKETQEKTQKELSKDRKWYQGGTLHKASALEWQNATYDNKMATCADFFAAAYEGKTFKQTILSSIKSTDDTVPYVEKLVADMDTALSKEPAAKKNEMMYANQRVNEIAAMLMVMNGWTKPQ